jgi:phosphoglycerate dehydrogenase-like enzyme
VLIVGAGDLGEQTARRLRAFDAEPVMVARHARADVMVDAALLARMHDGALLLTPHVAGAVDGFPARSYALVGEQIGRYSRGEPLLNVVSGTY